MKKVLTLMGVFALAACAGNTQSAYVVAATQGEMAARNLETPEQTDARHNATLAQVNSTLPEGMSFGNTCEEIRANMKMDKELLTSMDENSKEIQDAYKALRQKFPGHSENRCDVCKAKETEKLVNLANVRIKMLEQPGVMFGGSVIQVSDEAFVTKMVDVFNMCKKNDTADTNEAISELKTMLLDMKGAEQRTNLINVLQGFDCSGACAGETLSRILNQYL